MTKSMSSDYSDSHLLRALREACRISGMRLTPQRLEVYRELARSEDHPSAEELHQRLLERMPSLSLDTVYRTLATFARHGLIHKLDTAESQGRFEVADDTHHHLVCSRCKEIMDFHWPGFDQSGVPEEIAHWGRIERKNAVIYGICNKCLKKNRTG